MILVSLKEFNNIFFLILFWETAVPLLLDLKRHYDLDGGSYAQYKIGEITSYLT